MESYQILRLFRLLCLLLIIAVAIIVLGCNFPINQKEGKEPELYFYKDSRQAGELTYSLDDVKIFPERHEPWEIRSFLSEDNRAPRSSRVPGSLEEKGLLHKKIDLNPVKLIENNSDTSENTKISVLAADIYEKGHLDKEIDAERLCPHQGADTKLLMMITSAPANAEARLTIRQTWGTYANRRDIGMGFVLGRQENATIHRDLNQEHFLYGDLIRGNSIDSVNNLTLKTISLLEWVDLHCQKAKYILKTDDDMFINVPRLLDFIVARQDQRRVIYGILAKGFRPIRFRLQKYYVPRSQFAGSVYPSFTIGSGYIISGDIVHELFQRSLTTNYVQLEDVFTTGIVADSLGVARVQVKEFINKRLNYSVCNVRKAITLHKIKPHEMFELWQKLLDTSRMCNSN